MSSGSTSLPVVSGVVAVGVTRGGSTGAGGSSVRMWLHLNFMLCSMLTLTLLGQYMWCAALSELKLTQCTSLALLLSLELYESSTQTLCPHSQATTRLGFCLVSALHGVVLSRALLMFGSSARLHASQPFPEPPGKLCHLEHGLNTL